VAGAIESTATVISGPDNRNGAADEADTEDDPE
jgi:hypothetical protein